MARGGTSWSTVPWAPPARASTPRPQKAGRQALGGFGPVELEAPEQTAAPYGGDPRGALGPGSEAALDLGRRAAGRDRPGRRAPGSRAPRARRRRPEGSPGGSPCGGPRRRSYHAAMTSRRPTVAATGSPPPSALPQQSRSGRTASWSTAKRSPVRPKPVKISSATSSAPRSRQTAARAVSQPSGGGMTPSLPTTGSTRTAASGDPLGQAVDLLGRAAVGQAVEVGMEVVPEGRPERVAGGGGEGAEGDPVVGGVEGEHGGAAGGEDGALDRDLDRVGAGDGEVDSRVVDRRQGRRGARRERSARGARRRRRGRGAGAGLGRGGGDHFRVAVADGGDAEPGGQVEEAVAVDVEDVGAEGLVPDQARGVLRRVGRAGEGVDARGLGGGERPGERPGDGSGGRDEDLGRQVAADQAGAGARRATRVGRSVRRLVGPGARALHSRRRPAMERPRVTSSVYSMSPPTGMPKARRESWMSRGARTRAR